MVWEVYGDVAETGARDLGGCDTDLNKNMRVVVG